MDNRADLLKQVTVTTNKALVLSCNGSRSSPTNDLPANDNSTGQAPAIMNAVTVDKLSLAELEQQLNSESDLSNFLDLIEISRSLPFTKSAGTLEDEEDEEEKFQIKIRVKEEANLKIASIQLLSSEEMFELHCGETNEYISSVYCDFIDKVDQQFVIYYGCQNLVRNLAKSSSASALRSESSLKKSLNIVFPKFNSTVKDTIWIFAVKLNLVECRSTNFNSNLSNPMASMLPFMQMLAGKADNGAAKPPDLRNLFNQLNSKPSSHSLPQFISQLLPKDSPSDFSDLFRRDQCEVDAQNNQANQRNPATNDGPCFGGLASKAKSVHRRKRRLVKKRRSNDDLVLKKLISLEQKMNLIDQKLSDLQLEISSSSSRTN